MAVPFTESEVEAAALGWLQSLGWNIAHGPDIAPDTSAAERANFSTVLLEGRLRDAMARLNPTLPRDAILDAFRRLTNPEGADVVQRNRAFHRMLVSGINIQYATPSDGTRGAQVKVIDFDNPAANDWLALNQFTIIEGGNNRRPDVLLFVNGLPLGLIELKNAADERATIWSAFQQLQTYQAQIPSIFTFNELLVISDGLEGRLGAVGAGREWFKPWRTIEGQNNEDLGVPHLEVLLRGICQPQRLLDFIRDFIIFEDDGSGRLVKKLAGYHQFHAVQVAVAETLRAAALAQASLPTATAGGALGDRRIGVVWHTQGSGKSLTMAFYAGRVIREPAMSNPTVVVLTDRNDLDDQLFGTFARCQDLLRQPPVQATSRAELRRLLSVNSGGVVFATIQKFMPEERGDRHPLLSNRHNIVVIADEAHRSQYDFIDGFARHLRDALPNASFVGFTGTPIEKADANTRAVFGDYISVYDIQRSVQDGATVSIYYESRLAKLALKDEEKPLIDHNFDEVTEGEELERKEKLKSKWAQLEAIVGAGKRLSLLAQDIVNHFERRLEVLEGKGMIVCMSRRICVELYSEIARLRPEWVHDEDDQGQLKVVMTGSASDPLEWQRHVRNKAQREAMAKRFRDPADSFRLVIVRDMWLTGFDAPSLHTLYLDKPMRGHGLMQAIARVNRVFRDKPGGLVVDYLGLATELKEALTIYTESGGKGQTAINQAEALHVMKEKYEVCDQLFFGFDRSPWHGGDPSARLRLLPAALEHILALTDGQQRLLDAVAALSKAFALAVPHEEALAVANEVAFFQAVRAALAKRAVSNARPEEDLDRAVREIVARSVAPEGVVDIFAAAGLNKPDISILSDQFLAEVRGMPHRNLAVEVLRRLLDGQIKSRRRKNVVQARSFAELLEQALRRYQNRAIEAAQLLEELITLAKEMRQADSRGEAMGLSDEELAFYDALETNDSAVKVLGDEALRTIARELLTAVRNNVTIDWTLRENVRAQLRVLVKRVLRKYGYPPDKQDKATLTVLEQVELLSEAWAA